ARRRVALAPERTVVRVEPKRPGNNAGAAQVRAPVNSLAGFAVGFIDGTSFWHRCRAGGQLRSRSRLCRSTAEAVAAAVGYGVELAGVDGGFLGAGRGQGTEVVGGFQATVPGHAVGHVELLAAGASDVEVQRLRLVDPLLAAAGGVYDPAGFHFEGGRVEVFELLRDALDLLHRTVVVLEVVDHYRVPQAARLEVAHRVGVDHSEVARPVRFHVEVLVGRLDGLRHAGDIGDGRGRRDGHDVRVADAVLHALAHRGPVQGLGQVDIDVLLATGLDEDLLGI